MVRLVRRGTVEPSPSILKMSIRQCWASAWTVNMVSVVEPVCTVHRRPTAASGRFRKEPYGSAPGFSTLLKILRKHSRLCALSCPLKPAIDECQQLMDGDHQSSVGESRRLMSKTFVLDTN